MRRLVARVRARFAAFRTAFRHARAGVPDYHAPAMQHVPVRSTKRDLERAMQAAAEHHAGRHMTRAQARAYIHELAERHPDLQLAIPSTTPAPTLAEIRAAR